MVLRFSVRGIPVEIRPSFWLVAALIAPFPIASSLRPALLPFLLVWIVVVTVSVLLHEGGHAFLARRFGATVSITLYGVGGYTTWQTPAALGPWRRTAVAAAGSVVGFVLGGVAWWLGPDAMPPVPSPAELAVVSFWQVNILWGVLNWLPIRPLDGGHIFLGVLEGLFGATGRKMADLMFPLTTLAGAVLAFRAGLVLLGLFALFLLVNEARGWRRGTSSDSPSDALSSDPPSAIVDEGPLFEHDGNEDL